MVGDQPGDLGRLQELARDKTPAGREVLTNTIGEMFSERNETLSAHERALMSEILRQLIKEVETSVRQTLARRLASVGNAPHDVVLALANDVIEVAHPLLVESGMLQDPELIDIVRNRTLEHQLAVAVRRSLSEHVADALIATENVHVVTTLLRNPDARIASKTMDYLVHQSQRVDAYQDPLLRRRELTPALAGRMYRWVSAALRQQILANFEIDPTMLDTVAATATEDLLGPHRHPDRPAEEELADRLAADGSLHPPVIVQALRDSEVPLFTALFAKFAGIPRPLVRRMLFEPGLEGLCIASKAAGIDRSSFASIYLLSRKVRHSESSRQLSDMAGILSLYDRVDATAARVLLGRWQTDSQPAYHA